MRGAPYGGRNVGVGQGNKFLNIFQKFLNGIKIMLYNVNTKLGIGHFYVFNNIMYFRIRG